MARAGAAGAMARFQTGVHKSESAPPIMSAVRCLAIPGLWTRQIQTFTLNAGGCGRAAGLSACYSLSTPSLPLERTTFAML